MTNVETLIEAIEARLADESDRNLPYHRKLKVEPKKIDVVELWNRPPEPFWHNGVANDFCLYTNIVAPTAAYLYVIKHEDSLRSTLVLSDGWDVLDHRPHEQLDPSLEVDALASQLIEKVLNASQEIISNRYLHNLTSSQLLVSSV